MIRLLESPNPIPARALVSGLYKILDAGLAQFFGFGGLDHVTVSNLH